MKFVAGLLTVLVLAGCPTTPSDKEDPISAIEDYPFTRREEAVEEFHDRR